MEEINWIYDFSNFIKNDNCKIEKPKLIDFQFDEIKFPNWKLLNTSYPSVYIKNNNFNITTNFGTFILSHKINRFIKLNNFCINERELVYYINNNFYKLFYDSYQKISLLWYYSFNGKQINDLKDIKEEYNIYKPSIGSLKWNITKDHPTGVDYSYIDKFNCDITKKDNFPLMVLKDKQVNNEKNNNKENWVVKTYMSQCYDKLFTENYSYDLLHNVPSFDTYSCLVYNEFHKKYIFYTRANIIYGERFFQYSMSDDMIKWSKFEILNLPFEFGKCYNYYFPCFYSYNNLVFGLLTLIDMHYKTAQLKLFVSSDMVNFKFVSDLTTVIQKSGDVIHSKSNMLFFPNSFLVDKDVGINVNDKRDNFQFLHSRWTGFNDSKSSVLQLLRKVTMRKDGFSYVCNVNNKDDDKNEKGHIITKPITGNVKINFDGIIFFRDQVIKGNFTDYNLCNLKNEPLEFKFTGKIYSFTGHIHNEEKFYTHIKFYYFEYFSYFKKNKKNKNRSIKLGFLAKKIVNIKYTNNATKCTATILDKNNKSHEIILVKNFKTDILNKNGLNKEIPNGTQFVLLNIRLQ